MLKLFRTHLTLYRILLIADRSKFDFGGDTRFGETLSSERAFSTEGECFD